MYLAIGHRRGRTTENGISIFRYEPSDGSVEYVGRFCKPIHVGFLAASAKRDILYATDEVTTRGDKFGGYADAVALDKINGTAELIGEVPTNCANPTAAEVDEAEEYLLVSHHGNVFTKELPDGTRERTYDAGKLMLYRLAPDGSIGELCDTWKAPSPDGVKEGILHIVERSPLGDFYAVCDKGLNKVYMFTIDRENAKIVLVCTADDRPGVSPRYCAFHGELPFLYENNECGYWVNCWRYDEKGRLTLAGSIDMCPEQPPLEPGSIGPSDIKVNPNGKAVYITVRSTNELVAVSAEADGSMKMLARLSCGGEDPRAIAVSPDGRFLFCCNVGSDKVVVFALDENGTPSYDREIALPYPGAITFVE